MPGSAPEDLVVLTADKNIHYGLRGLLARPQAIGVRPIGADFLVHPRRDPGCVGEGHDLLRPLAARYKHAVVVFDLDGSGREADGRVRLETEVQGRLAASGWDDRAEAVVIAPELEAWVFSPSPQVETCLGWRRARGPLRGWLEGQGAWAAGQAKPGQPREALERALRAVNRPRSSALYECLGRRVGVTRCEDAAFRKLLQTLRAWFPA
jgi:hypothetical protein